MAKHVWNNLRIISPLRVEFAGPKSWRLLEPMTVLWDEGQLHVFSGFETDLATVPRPFRNFISSDGALARPAIFHDALYTNAADGGEEWGRLKADYFFLCLAEIEGASWLQRNLAYSAVVLGGWTMWRDGEGEQ